MLFTLVETARSQPRPRLARCSRSTHTVGTMPTVSHRCRPGQGSHSQPEAHTVEIAWRLSHCGLVSPYAGLLCDLALVGERQIFGRPGEHIH